VQNQNSGSRNSRSVYSFFFFLIL